MVEGQSRHWDSAIGRWRVPTIQIQLIHWHNILSIYPSPNPKEREYNITKQYLDSSQSPLYPVRSLLVVMGTVRRSQCFGPMPPR